MTQDMSSSHVRAALFVDFDNIYLGLQREDPTAAEQFATDPGHWLRWLQEKLSLDHVGKGAGAPVRRRILFRRCYLNPSQFGRFRPYFTRSAFEVVDCPPLTSGGKTSADIQMVMDILDALGHATYFEEFIILSGDADFTPVLLRLSKHDRRSTVLAIGPASVAYKASCDLLIDQDTFLEDAMGVTVTPSNGTEGPRTTVMQDLLQSIADKVYEKASAVGELVATDLPGIYREFSEFTSSTNWLGFNSLRGMTGAVIQVRRDLEMLEGDPWRVRVGETSEEDEEGGGYPSSMVSRERPTPAAFMALTEEILEYVRTLVAESEVAVPMARAAQMVISRFGEEVLDSRWAGAGTFRDLLEGSIGSGFEVSALKPGYLYDPQRHQLPANGRPDELPSTDPKLSSLAWRVHQLTDTPYLTPGEYALIFRHISEEVNHNGYFLTRTSKAVRDLCIEEGATVARASVNFILRGITFGGHRFGQNGEDNAVTIAQSFFKNVLGLCDSAGLTLTQDELDILGEWILGEIRENPPEPVEPTPQTPQDIETAPDEAAQADQPTPETPQTEPEPQEIQA